MSCSCHLNAPCWYCVQSFECEECCELCNESEVEMIELQDKIICGCCLEIGDTKEKLLYLIGDQINSHLMKLYLNLSKN